MVVVGWGLSLYYACDFGRNFTAGLLGMTVELTPRVPPWIEIKPTWILAIHHHAWATPHARALLLSTAWARLCQPTNSPNAPPPPSFLAFQRTTYARGWPSHERARPSPQYGHGWTAPRGCRSSCKRARVQRPPRHSNALRHTHERGRPGRQGEDGQPNRPVE